MWNRAVTSQVKLGWAEIQKRVRKEKNKETKTSHVYYRICYIPAGNGKAKVKDNNESERERVGGITEDGEGEEKINSSQTETKKRRMDKEECEWQATAQGCLGSGCSDPLTFTGWPIAPCHPTLEKFKRTLIHRRNATPCGLTHSLTSLCRPPLRLCVLLLSVCLFAHLSGFTSVSYPFLHFRQHRTNSPSDSKT